MTEEERVILFHFINWKRHRDLQSAYDKLTFALLSNDEFELPRVVHNLLLEAYTAGYRVGSEE